MGKIIIDTDSINLLDYEILKNFLKRNEISFEEKSIDFNANKTDRELCIAFMNMLTYSEREILQKIGVFIDTTTGFSIEKSIKNSLSLQLVYLVKMYYKDAKLIEWKSSECVHFIGYDGMQIALNGDKVYTSHDIFNPIFSIKGKMGENFKFKTNYNED